MEDRTGGKLNESLPTFFDFQSFPSTLPSNVTILSMLVERLLAGFAPYYTGGSLMCKGVFD